MTTAQAIARHVDALPEAAQREILDFVEFIESRTRSPHVVREGDRAWSAFSLSSAMRGMADEPSLYTIADLKESFR